jgi:hypothetical protein
MEMAINIELNDDEVDALLEVLTYRLASLGVEIRHTDNRSFREGLRQQRELLRRVQAILVDQLSAGPPNERQRAL